MFENIGEKLKTVAGIFAFFGTFAGIILLIISIADISEAYSDLETIIAYAKLIGSIILIVNSLFNAWLFYGVGEAVTNSKETAEEQVRQRVLIDEIKSNIIDKSDEKDSKTQEKIEKITCSKCGNKITRYPCPFCDHKE